MCTVTFVRLKDSFCITSSRDEKVARERAIHPTKYIIKNKEIVFPKDPKAGGTWFAHDKKNILVLLNGAKEKHIPKTNYRKSRGLILIDLIITDNPLKEWHSIDLNNIEPFTIIYFNGIKLYQFQWNEIEKTTLELNSNENHIWSSSTLYEEEIREKRNNWFNKFLVTNSEIKANSLLNFHQFTEPTNKDFGLQINRNNILKTVSITQVEIKNETISLQYIDLFD
ncbi:hypothetical protein SY27_00010 [Flavobacterium sp. 316]|uniref:hypothetical protein n=1 Tax=Flavobacterium sp. 316 TaxID=1603293 RepID=UPI0005E8443C|nr:hypothetical protein [Flavobacterium sp. 316]KIX22287.1 hypothetical protein SY27_00010 [Flavobacterium sp. 316]